jgi:hypothetical protein
LQDLRSTAAGIALYIDNILYPDRNSAEGERHVCALGLAQGRLQISGEERLNCWLDRLNPCVECAEDIDGAKGLLAKALLNFGNRQPR